MVPTIHGDLAKRRADQTTVVDTTGTEGPRRANIDAKCNDRWGFFSGCEQHYVPKPMKFSRCPGHDRYSGPTASPISGIVAAGPDTEADLGRREPVPPLSIGSKDGGLLADGHSR